MSSTVTSHRSKHFFQQSIAKRSGLKGLASCALTFMLMSASSTSLADARDQAKRIHDRLTGVPASADFLNTHGTGGATLDNPRAVADAAIEHDAFYDVTLKNFVAPWTNEDESVFVPFNDYIATVIGMIRDDLDFRLVLSGDILYKADDALNGLDGNPLPAYAVNNNDHYVALDESGHPLRTALVRELQSDYNGLPPEATAGVMTSRQAAKEFLSPVLTALCFVLR